MKEIEERMIPWNAHGDKLADVERMLIYILVLLFSEVMMRRRHSYIKKLNAPNIDKWGIVKNNSKI